MRYLDKSFNLDFDAIGRESVNSLTTIVRILRLQKKQKHKKKNDHRTYCTSSKKWFFQIFIKNKKDAPKCKLRLG